MASTFNALVCAGLATVFWTGVGLPLALRVAPRALALTIAPALGWAVHSVLALPVFFAVGLTRTTLIVLVVLSVLAALAALRFAPRDQDAPAGARPPVWALGAAALLALGVMAAVLPKLSAEGVALAGPMFDHSKIAMIDEMARLGVPPGNPFFGEKGGFTRLSYYYLWHFSAAELALLTGLGGWNADAGLSWFTAFASLTMMMGLATFIAGRASAAIWVVALAATGSLRPVLSIFGDGVKNIIGWPSGFGGWVFQISWAPQHVASAGCVVLSMFLLARLAQTPRVMRAILFALLAAAAFQSSTWIGGITFPIAAGAIASAMIARSAPADRWRFAACIAVAALIAATLCAPFLLDQFQTTALRGGGGPVALTPYGIFGDSIPEPLRRILDVPAYWVIFLVVEFIAFYPAGLIAFALLARDRTLADDHKPMLIAFALLALASLFVGGWLASTVADNNDLAWRGVLPGVMVLIVAAAAGVSRYVKSWRSPAVIAAIVAIALGYVQGGLILFNNMIVPPHPSGEAFAQSPSMWEAVRRHARPDQRIANNPFFLRDVTAWPVNISWALLSNRRSCYAGRDLALPFAPLTKERREDIDKRFTRIFAGAPQPDDLRLMVQQYRCDVAIVTARDGAWFNDPFEGSLFYRLAETEPLAWRIYVAADGGAR